MKAQESDELRTCFVATYPPRECGIATFTYDLRDAISKLQTESRPLNVIALRNTRDSYEYPSEVVFEIRQNQLNDYRLAAEYINLSGVDVVCLQHEFGIFGGPEGSYITEFLEGLKKPVVTTLHTVLPEPPAAYRDSLMQVASLSDYLVVLNSKAKPILHDTYKVPDEKICLIHHGVPDVPFMDPNYYKDKFGVEGRLVILTFGLLNRNKGIECMLDALPDIVKVHPHVVYLVLGATHPEVKRREGEEYRLSLQRRVRSLGLEDHVIFYDRYVELSELLEFIGASDIYITPYQSRDQIVSGTLAYAVGMGKAVVSTPYLYAEELLSEGRGRLIEFGNSSTLSQTILKLIERPAIRHRMRKKAYQYGRQMIWSEVAARYEEVFERAKELPMRSTGTRKWTKLPLAGSEVPEIRLDHLIRLTDDTGLIQHATYGVPDRRFGYSTDDVGRALVVALMYYRQFQDERVVDLCSRYLSFLGYAQLPDGRFHNFMNYSREFADEVGGEDTTGRALWGLGAAVAYAPTEGMSALARDMFERSLNALDLHHPRSMAYAICGLFNFLKRYDGASQVRRKLVDLANSLAAHCHEDEDWRWFGEDLTYANARMPQALLHAYQATGDEKFKQVGIASLDFLLKETYRDGMFDFVGNDGWYKRGEHRAIFSQQPIEAGYTAEACLTAYRVTRSRDYLDLAQAAADWLLGRNRLGQRLYDLTTGGCGDGLDPQGVSLNQGAESVICALLTLLVAGAQPDKEIAPGKTEVETSTRWTEPAAVSAAATGDVRK